MNIHTLVDRFLTWPLPEGTCADPCACNPTYPNRTGTNLLNADQARQMLEHVLQPAQLQEPILSAGQITPEMMRPLTQEDRDELAEVLKTHLKPTQQGWQPAQSQHPDDQAVDRFAAMMKENLAKAREKGRNGWETCPPEELSRMLREHVEKGDPCDVANFCMMLGSLGVGITAPVAQEPVLAGRWHHGNGILCSGSLRIAHADFDTNPPLEMQDRVFDDICKAMNASLASNHSTPLLPPAEHKPLSDLDVDAKFVEWCISKDRHANKPDDSDADNYWGMKIYVNDCMRQAWRAAISLAMKGGSS